MLQILFQQFQLGKQVKVDWSNIFKIDWLLSFQLLISAEFTNLGGLRGFVGCMGGLSAWVPR